MKKVLLNSVSTEETSSTPTIARGSEIPPLTIGPERFYYFYSTVLPQIHLVLVSVLQGIAFGVLLLEIPIPSDMTHIPSLEFILNQHFYFPYLISSLLILDIWLQFAFACMFALWPLSMLQIVLIYLITLVEVISFRLVSVPATGLSTWLMSLGLIGIVGGWIRLNNLRLERKGDYDSVDFGESTIKSELYDGVLYMGMGFVIVVFGVFYGHIVDMLRGLGLLVSLLPWFVYIFLTLFILLVIWLQLRDYQVFFRLLIDGSGLVMSSNGVIRYEEKYGIKKDGVKSSIPLSPQKDEQLTQEQLAKSVHFYSSAKRFFYKSILFGGLSFIVGVITLIFIKNSRLKK